MFASGMQDILGQEMVKDRDKLQQRIKDLQANISQAQSVQNNTATSSSQRGGDSWASYSKWNDYDDVEDLEVEIGTAKEALKKLNDKINGHNTDDAKTCNHRYQCSCIGDKSVERQVVQMTTQKRLDEMVLFKREGNELFGQQKYNEALNLYEKTLVYFEYCYNGTQEELKQADCLRLQCLLNAAACFLHLKVYTKCIEYCDEALEIDNSSSKAWFRRAKAHRLTGKLEIAENNITRAKQTLGDNSSMHIDIKREMKLLEYDKRKEKALSGELAAAMIR